MITFIEINNYTNSTLIKHLMLSGAEQFCEILLEMSNSTITVWRARKRDITRDTAESVRSQM